VILRSLQVNQNVNSAGDQVPAWEAIEHSQRQMMGAKECWLITQPAHAALSAEIALKLKPEIFGAMDDATIRAIALHDSGWSASDANAIQASRSTGGKKSAGSKSPGQILPFIAVDPRESLAACAASIEMAEKVSALGGFLVSEHFRNIAMANHDKAPALISKFVASEELRQKKLRPKISLPDAEIQRLVEGLRFCDLLSLYLCSGASESIEFPQKTGGKNIVLERTGNDQCSMSPFPFATDEIFGVSALRHPKLKEQSSSRFFLKVSE
jgi:hypothetical protein